MATTSTCKAVVCTSVGVAEVKDVHIPKPREGYVLIKTKAVAVNPTDWKSIHYESGESVGTRVGCDYAGVVEEVGPGVSKPFKKGDRICGIAFGGEDTERGAFGEHMIAKGDLQIKIPDNLSFEEAATLGVGITTVGQGLYQLLKLPLPTKPASTPTPILIYGGSTATGTLGIQFAKLSGLQVLTTSSPRNFDYLKSLGADAVFDYHVDPDTLAKEIKLYTKNRLTIAWDCSPTSESAHLCAASMSDSERGTYGSLGGIQLDDLKAVNPMVSAGFTIGYTIFGERFTRGWIHCPAKPEDWDFGKMFWELSRELLAEDKVKVARIAVDQGGSGLDGVLKGLDDLRTGRVSGTKLVYRL